jgi:hypothetical protein
LVDDLITDGTYKTAEGLRVSATLSTGYQIRNRKTGEINELATELFHQKWFYQLLKIRLISITRGNRIVEFTEFNGHDIRFGIVPPRNVVPPEKRVYPDLSKENVYVNYTDDEWKSWVIEFNAENPLGLINDIIPNLIWLRNVFQSWMEFCEKFGQPLVSATTNNSNADHLDKVEAQLLALAEASVGVFPEGTSIKFDEANRTDAYNVFANFIKNNADLISSVLVGSSTLSNGANNRSQTEVHERSLDFKISQADRREVEYTVNDDLLPILRMQGYSYISEDDVFEWIESKEEIDIQQYWNIVNGILLSGYEIDQDWLSETFNIPITGKSQKSFQPQITNENEDEETNPENLNKPGATWRRPNYS